MSERQRIVVVGSGIAGLIAALELSHAHEVTLVTKLELTESNTRWAQGGIAAAMSSDDSVAEHIEDTLRAGAGLCNEEAVRLLCSEGPARIHDLIRLGVGFDQHDGELSRGLEAAHSHPRVLHAGGDATGLSIELALVRAVRAANVTVLEHTFAADLLLDKGRVSGLEVVLESGKREKIAADAVVLASGGAGQVFLHTTNPRVATGDGAALALRAGAELADVEFYQFHPTALATPDTFLISEAVRGEGAVLLDNHGRRFMQAIDERAELAPRDVVARGIARQMAAQDGEAVLLDAMVLEQKHGVGFLARRFPSIHAACLARGFDWTKQPVPVTPAAHYWMGGIRTDLVGQTSIAGLYAVGEVACTGVHGANRLASNSLLESLVFAHRCAAHLNLESSWTHVLPTSLQGNERESPVSQSSTPLPDRRTLQQLMWSAAGIERNGEAMRAALEQLTQWRVEGTDIASLETANLLTVARALVSQALVREESRGAHFRNDFPETLPAWRHSLIYTQPVAQEEVAGKC